MEESLWIVAASVAVVFAIATILQKGTKKSSSSSSSPMKWPVGPRKFPVIGNLHQLGGDVLHVALDKLAKVHGSVMTIWIGSWRPVIVVSDIDKAWEVLVNKSSDYAARDMPEITKIASGNWHTISTSDSGSFWLNLRKGLQNGALSPLNISGQSQFQERDVKLMVESMREEAALNNGIVKPLDHIKKATVRLLSRLIFGKNFDDDVYVEAMHHAIDDTIRISGYARLAEAFSYAQYLPSHKRAIKETYQVKGRVEELVRPFLSSRPPTNSYLHFLLSQQDYSEEVITFCIFELYLLGVDSTSSTTTWALGFLVSNQVVQEKLYGEINKVTGGSQIVKIEDVSKLQYLQAVMKETMRMKPIAPVAIPHKTAKETKLMGTKVAKGTRVMVNLYALHHNPKVWTEPHRFMPERFLQGDHGSAQAKAMEQNFLPFSAGMRICAGMELGKLQFGFALANLVNAFKWSCAVDGELPDMSEELSFVLLMKNPLAARIVPRSL